MKDVVVTGAGGFIGGHLVESLLHQGHKAVAQAGSRLILIALQGIWIDVHKQWSASSMDYSGGRGRVRKYRSDHVQADDQGQRPCRVRSRASRLRRQAGQ